jgi:hypothetical protein
MGLPLRRCWKRFCRNHTHSIKTHYLLGMLLIFGHPLLGVTLAEQLNKAQTYVNIRLEVFEDDADNKATLLIYGTPGVNGINSAATITVATETVSKSLADLRADDKIEGTINFTTVPDPLATNGYWIQVLMLAVKLNLDQFSPTYFRFKTLKVDTEVPLKIVTTSENQTVGMSFMKTAGGANMKQWFFLPQGVVLADSWDDQYLIVSKTVGETRVGSFTYEMPYAQIMQMQPGVYWLSVVLNMFPRQTTITDAEEKALNDVQLNTQRNVLFNLRTQAETKLTGQTTLHSLTTAQAAVVTANLAKIQKEIDEINAILP